MQLPDLDPSWGNSFIDANALHYSGGAEDTATDEILRLLETGEGLAFVAPFCKDGACTSPHSSGSEAKSGAIGLLDADTIDCSRDGNSRTDTNADPRKRQAWTPRPRRFSPGGERKVRTSLHYK